MDERSQGAAALLLAPPDARWKRALLPLPSSSSRFDLVSLISLFSGELCRPGGGGGASLSGEESSAGYLGTQVRWRLLQEQQPGGLARWAEASSQEDSWKEEKKKKRRRRISSSVDLMLSILVHVCVHVCR